MNITYFHDTDTLLINFNKNTIVDTQEINENTIIELDNSGNVVSMTIEHAKNKTEINSLSFNQILEKLVAV